MTCLVSCCALSLCLATSILPSRGKERERVGEAGALGGMVHFGVVSLSVV